MKIIHLSDTHVGYDDNANRFKKIAGHIIANCAPASDYLIIHTGDVIDREYDVKNHRPAIEVFEKLENAGFKIFLCPGNHDYGDESGMRKDCAQEFRRDFGKYLFPDSAKTFPVKTIVKDNVFIGLDSCAAELRYMESWFAEGRIGKTQLSALNEMLAEEEKDRRKEKKIILYLHHHPFTYASTVRPGYYDPHWRFHLIQRFTQRFRRLIDAYSLLQIIRDRVDVLLFGHRHFGLDCSVDSQRYGMAIGLDASSSTCTRMDTNRMRYRIIDLSIMSVQINLLPEA